MLFRVSTAWASMAAPRAELRVWTSVAMMPSKLRLVEKWVAMPKTTRLFTARSTRLRPVPSLGASALVLLKLGADLPQ